MRRREFLVALGGAADVADVERRVNSSRADGEDATLIEKVEAAV
jgi:hypothetical protein